DPDASKAQTAAAAARTRGAALPDGWPPPPGARAGRRSPATAAHPASPDPRATVSRWSHRPYPGRRSAPAPSPTRHASYAANRAPPAPPTPARRGPPTPRRRPTTATETSSRPPPTPRPAPLAPLRPAARTGAAAKPTTPSYQGQGIRQLLPSRPRHAHGRTRDAQPRVSPNHARRTHPPDAESHPMPATNTATRPRQPRLYQIPARGS